MTHLRSINGSEPIHGEELHVAGSDTGIPPFEGLQVDHTRFKLTSAGDLEVDAVHGIDNVVRMFVEGCVTRIDHVVDAKTGHLKRVHTIKVVDAIELPWDFDLEAELERYRNRRG